MRTFIALPLPEDSLKLLQGVQARLRSFGADVRWISIDSVHLTLKFLGEIDPSLLPGLSEGFKKAAAAHKRFLLFLRGLGAFPDLRSPRVIWCGIEGEAERLDLLQKDIEKICAAAGFPPEARPFRPHLTLGRVRGKKNLQPLADYIKIGSEFESRIEVSRVNIYKSTLTRRGPLYEVLETIMLAGQEP
jgi:2'-5' RNA ligase